MPEPSELEWELGSRAAGAFQGARPGPLPSPADVLVPGARLGEHTLGPRLGAGTSGVVFRAVGSRGPVALKVLNRTQGKDLARFTREAETAAALVHPGIVRVHAAGEDGGLRWIAYELVEPARPFEEALEALELPARLELVARLAEAVAHAHARGVVHRDLKPENVLVDAAGHPRVTDFGLALRPELERLTRSGAWVGTPRYMAPEQLTGERARQGPPTDVWALGVMLFQSLTGEHPFPAETALELLAQVTGGARPRARDVTPGVDARLDAVCQRALQREPGARYPDAGAFAAALRAALEPARWWPPRPGWAVGAGLLLSLSLVAALALGRAAPPAADTPGPAGAGPGEALRVLARADLVGIASAAANLSRAAATGPHAPAVRRELLAAQARILEELARPALDWSEPEDGRLLEERARAGLDALRAAAETDPAGAAALERERAAAVGDVADWARRLALAAGGGERDAIQAGRRCRVALGGDARALASLDVALRAEVERLAQAREHGGALLPALVLETLRADVLGLPLRRDGLGWLFQAGSASDADPRPRALHTLWLLRCAMGELQASRLAQLNPAWLAASAAPTRLPSLGALLRARDEDCLDPAGLRLARSCALGGAELRDDLPVGGPDPQLERQIQAQVGASVLGRLDTAAEASRGRPPGDEWLRGAGALAESLLAAYADVLPHGRALLLGPGARLLHRAEERGLRPPGGAAELLRREAARTRAEGAGTEVRSEVLLWQAQLALGDGRLEEAQRALDEADGLGLTRGYAFVRLAFQRALLEQTRGRLDLAERALDQAEAQAGGAALMWWGVGERYALLRLSLARARGQEAECLERLRLLFPELPAELDRAHAEELRASLLRHEASAGGR